MSKKKCVDVDRDQGSELGFSLWMEVQVNMEWGWVGKKEICRDRLEFVVYAETHNF